MDYSYSISRSFSSPLPPLPELPEGNSKIASNKVEVSSEFLHNVYNDPQTGSPKVITYNLCQRRFSSFIDSAHLLHKRYEEISKLISDNLDFPIGSSLLSKDTADIGDVEADLAEVVSPVKTSLHLAKRERTFSLDSINARVSKHRDRLHKSTSDLEIVNTLLDHYGNIALELKEKVRQANLTGDFSVRLRSEVETFAKEHANALSILELTPSVAGLSEVNSPTNKTPTGIRPYKRWEYKGAPTCILLVEDNELNMKIMTRYLSKFGYKMFTEKEQSRIGSSDKFLFCATTVQEANEWITKYSNNEIRVDLAFLDIELDDSRIKGDDLANSIRQMEKIKQVTSGIPLIAVTANAAEINDEQYRLKGLNGAIPKPVKFDIIESVLNGQCLQAEFAQLVDL